MLHRLHCRVLGLQTVVACHYFGTDRFVMTDSSAVAEHAPTLVYL
jgi:hypothetical protein